MTPHFHTGIPIWKLGLTHHHMEMGNARFHLGNNEKRLPVSIQGSPYGNGDQHIPIWKWGMPIFIRGIIRNGSPFPYGNLQMEMGIDTSPYGNGNRPFPLGITYGHPHMETENDIWLPISIRRSPYGNRY
jgi:hypothetical protein